MKENREVLQQVRVFVREVLGNDASGHDHYHAERVAALARHIAEREGANAYVCELAALVHDVIDDKLVDDAGEALNRLSSYLRDVGVSPTVLDAVCSIITTMSFKGGNQRPLATLEAKVVQDADRLDAIGAIGIARTFAYSGAKGQKMYDPEIPVRTEMSAEEYRQGKSTAVNHFHEKLLKLSERMNTTSAKQIAEERHQFLQTFLKRFMSEWAGQA